MRLTSCSKLNRWSNKRSSAIALATAAGALLSSGYWPAVLAAWCLPIATGAGRDRLTIAAAAAAFWTAAHTPATISYSNSENWITVAAATFTGAALFTLPIALAGNKTILQTLAVLFFLSPLAVSAAAHPLNYAGLLLPAWLPLAASLLITVAIYVALFHLSKKKPVFALLIVALFAAVCGVAATPAAPLNHNHITLLPKPPVDSINEQARRIAEVNALAQSNKGHLIVTPENHFFADGQVQQWAAPNALIATINHETGEKSVWRDGVKIYTQRQHIPIVEREYRGASVRPDGGPDAVLICYETMLPSRWIGAVAGAEDTLIVLANTHWAHDSVRRIHRWTAISAARMGGLRLTYT